MKETESFLISCALNIITSISRVKHHVNSIPLLALNGFV